MLAFFHVCSLYTHMPLLRTPKCLHAPWLPSLSSPTLTPSRVGSQDLERSFRDAAQACDGLFAV